MRTNHLCAGVGIWGARSMDGYREYGQGLESSSSYSCPDSPL